MRLHVNLSRETRQGMRRSAVYLLVVRPNGLASPTVV